MTTGPPRPEPPAGQPAGPGQRRARPALRVSSLEIFFDLVFAFTLTQLTSALAARLSWLTVGQVVLVFGLLWWMYGAYVWLTNSRPPVHTAERLLLLVGMGGFLAVGLAIPRGFASYGVVLGLGYLLAVLVHAILYYRVNANIVRIAPFNIASGVLVIAAGLLHNAAGTDNLAGYVLWILALALQLGSPLIVHPAGLFHLRADHLTERHSALLIIAIGESVAAVGAGAAGPVSHGPVSWRLLAGALLGLVVAAALWWLIFGAGDDDDTVRALSKADSSQRTRLALGALFYGNIPLLLGLVALAAGILRAVLQASGQPYGSGAGTRTEQAAVLAAGAALFLGGTAVLRWSLRTGPMRLRALAAVAALATTAVGATAGLEAQLVAVAVVLIAPLVAEGDRAGPAGDSRPEAGAAG